jgi:hypothetical protein
MPDLRQALKDFVATANSGKYPDEATLISKFPELQGYDVNALKDFVATANSGKYTNEDELFSKFPEFGISGQQPVSKKKVGTALPSGVGSSVSSKQPEEQDYFTGAFGSVLRGLDNIVPIGIGDFVDDMARSVAAGYRQGTAAQEADKLLLQGTKATPEQIQKFINANKNAQSLGASAEMQNYQKIYENEGKGFWGVVKGLANNPSIIPEVLTSSITAMATNTDALAAGAAGVGAGTAYGAGTGALAGGVGAIPGAAAGAIASVPYAFGLASSVVEMGSTFGELLQEELGGKEMTKENVKAILENPEKLNSIRNRAIARGSIIGTVDAFTGKLASGVGAKIVSRSAAKSATGAVTRGAATRAIAAGAAVEGAGGSLGEATARAAIGQEMDVSEIALEGIAELPGGIRSTIQARLAKPSYKVNGEKVSAEQVDEIINTMSPTDLAKTKIEIKNDYEGREFKIQDKIVTASIKEQVRQGNPELNEPSLNAITELEKDLKKLEGNTTQTGKDKAAAIRGQIKNIQENQLQEEAVTETIKSEQDAIQEQATDESVLRTEQPEMGLQQVGEGNVQPEVVTAGTEETITPEGTEEVVSSKTQVNIAPYFNTKIETVEEAEALRQNDNYKAYKQKLSDLATQLGIPNAVIDDVIGGYKNDAGEDFVEISNLVTLEGATIDQAEEFAALAATISPEVQEASIAAQYTDEGTDTHNANEYQVQVSDINGAMKALKEAGISNFSVNESKNTVSFIDVLDFADAELQDKIGRFTEILDENNISYEQSEYRPVESRYVDKGKRQEVLRRIKSKGSQVGQSGQGIYREIDQAIARDAEFQGVSPEAYLGIEAETVAEVAPDVVEEEAFEPITASDVKTPAFNRENALFYEEDERETDSGRMSTYLSSVTVEATNTDEEPLGTITKITDEDKIFYFTAEDADGNELNLDGYETLGDAKKAIADSYNKIQKKEFDKAAKKKAKDKAKSEAKKAKAKAKAEPTVEEVTEDVEGTLDELLALDPNNKTTGQKISAALEQALKDIEKFERENLGVNIALPVMKVIIKAVKALVDTGVALQEAIKRVAKDNNVSSRDVVNGINAVTQIAPIQEEYDALMVKADELIARQKRRGIADDKIVSNLDTFIRNSEVYKNANDLQKKIMEREARIKMGIGPKRAVSIGRVLGALKDITNITRAEKMLVIKRIRDLSRDAAKELAKEIREMAAGGKITAVQAANIVARFGKVNMLNEVSVSSFVDYMAKVFANAEYANKIDVAKSKLRAAKKNIVTKIGIADGLVGPLQRLFSINPTLIPDQYLDRYLELVDMFSARQAVLNLEEKSVVTKDVNDILNEIDNEQSKADELADRFNNSENKVFKDDELDYAASIKKMLDEKEIDEKEAETMRKYKEDIAPQVEETELTEEEAQQEKDELIAVVKASQVDGSELPSKDERDLAKEIARLIKTDALKGLTNTELKNLLKVIDNINNNYLPHYAQLMVEKMNAINNGKTLTNAIKNAKVAKFSGLYARIKSLITKKGAIVELIRRNPLFNIDQLFGDFKTKDIFNSVLNKAAEGEAKFSAELKKIQNILEKAEEKVAKSFKLDPNKTLMSKFKMMTYMIQLEFESNKGNKQVNPAADYLRATIKHIDAGKSQFGERDAEMLQDILDTYTDSDGNIDNEKLYKSFNQAEKDAINDIRGVNESLRDKAEYTAAIIRGDRINPLNNYVHLNVLHEHQPNDLTAGSAFITEYNDSMRPSTKAKSLIARTGKVSPLNFDVFASAQRGAKFVLMDYNLTEPIRTARKTINQAIANLEEEGRIPKQKRDIINAINSAFEEAIENLLTNSYVSTSIADDAIDYINKQGYRAILAGTGRFISELTSNIGFAVISDPKAFIEGAKYKGVIMSESAPLVMENVNSKQTNRIFPTDTLSGKLIDTSIIKQASGIKGGKSKNIVANKIQQIYNLTGKKYANVVELSADALISTPDKIIMRPMWFGSFANEFKKVSGKDVDFEKIAANDEKYMADNKEAIEQAKTVADERSVMTGATDNAFMGILKGTTKPNQSLLLRGFNNFNNFMTRFLIFEYVTARTAINAAIGNGSLTKKQGGALLGAVATRMMVYTLLTQMLGSGLMELAFGGEDEPEDEKSFMQKLGQSLASAFTSLTLGRDFGNASKGLLNYGVERANEKYLDFLREGDYDPYKDAIQYTIVPPERKGRPTDLFDYGINMLGSFGPAAKTTDLIIRKLSEPEKKEAAAIERQKKELTVRIPLEVLGNLGLVPLYKDVRKVVMKDMYKDLEQADENAENKRQIKLEKLQGYENESDMKRYDPELWEETFGPNAPEYDAEQAKKNIKKTKDSLERAMKDEMYNYTPKSKKGFGSAGFGSGKGKSKGGFGKSKFGQ